MSIRSLVISKLAPKIRAETTWSDVTSAVSGATAVQKAALLRSIQATRYEEVGKRICSLFGKTVQDRIEAEADAILADGALSQADIERLVG